MSTADKLRTAGLSVIEGRRMLGHRSAAASLTVRLTGTGRANEGTADLNGLVIPARGVAYVERSGRVWLLLDGPAVGDDAVVWVAAYRESDIGEAQQDAVDVLTAVLSVEYGLDGPDTPATAPDAASDEPAPDPGTTGGTSDTDT